MPMLYDLVQALACCAIFGMCSCRSMKLRGAEARPEYGGILVLLGGFAFGVAVSPLGPHWMHPACWLGLVGSIAAYLMDDEKRWRAVVPDDTLIPEARYSASERREADRRKPGERRE